MKRRSTILLVLGGLFLFAMIATLPELVAVWPERKVVKETFSGYTEALISQRFEEAYAYHSPEFQERVTLASFIQYQHDVRGKFGVLKSVDETGMTVQKWRNPSRWKASVQADFHYERAKVRFSFVLHRDNGRWTVFSSNGEEH
jgi:hypothetical protein